MRFLSPLTAEKLEMLHGQASYHRVIEREGKIGGFFIVLREGSGYEHVNYRRFAVQLPPLPFIDRNVVIVAV